MKYFQFILSILLLLCLLNLPYGYYVHVRFVAMVSFAVFAYEYYEKQQKPLVVTFGVLSMVFQPFVKIALGRTMWNVVDVAVAIILIALVIIGGWSITNSHKASLL